VNSNEIVLIYDGHCDFCVAWLRWLEEKLSLTALSFHDVSLAQYDLTPAECSKSIYVLTPDKRYAGTLAIAFLLTARGNLVPAFLLRSLGAAGRLAYRWIASHRSSFVIKYWTKLLERRLTNEG
jgi:predicted DCC family thiol-disulfide oxidoreductase YuxK